MADEAIRSFLAIELSESLKREALSFVETIQNQYPAFRFLPPQNWHLTLHFLGHITPEEVKILQLALPKTVAEIKPFSVSLEGLGAFPKEHPHILWLGVAGDTSALLALKKRCDQALEKLDFQIETRPYQPHITIARLKGQAPRSFLKPEKTFKSKNFDIIYNLTFFQSILSPKGLLYTPLSVFPFQIS